MTERSDWEGRVGRKWAEEWRRTDRSFAGLTERLLARVGSGSPRQVLDVGCGAGELSLAFARGHPDAEVVGVDVSELLVDVARERASNLANVVFEHGDAGAWSMEGFAPDLVISRHGVMFFADPVVAFSHIRATSADASRFVFSCFRTLRENVWAYDLAALVPGDPASPGEPHAPGPFAFADPDYVADILSDAGWSDIGFEPVDFAYVAGAGEDAVADAESYFLSIGPAARAAAELAPEDRERFIANLRGYLGERVHDNFVVLPAAAWIVSAANA